MTVNSFHTAESFSILFFFFFMNLLASSLFFKIGCLTCIGCVTCQGCEREVAETANGESDERKNESIMRLSWALVHSRQAEDVQRGIAMLECKIN